MSSSESELRLLIVELFLKQVPDFPSLSIDDQIKVIDTYVNYIIKGKIENDQRSSRKQRKATIQPEIEISNISDE